MSGSWKVYMIRCRTGELYTGSTVDLERRVKQHNRGKGAKFTRSRRPVTLVYQEDCPSRSVALRRENEIKRLSRAAKTLLIRSPRRSEHRQDSP